MLHTGFRLSEATLFSMTRLNGDQLFIRAKQHGGDLLAYVPVGLRDRLQVRAERQGERPFIVARSDRLEAITSIWRRRIAQAFDMAGVAE